MSRKLLTIAAMAVLVVAAFAIGAFVSPMLGLTPTSPGYAMHPGMQGMPGGMFGTMPVGPNFGWGIWLFAALRLASWLAGLLLMAALVAWLIRPRASAPPTSNPPQAEQR